MYNYFPNVPFWASRPMPQQDFDMPFDMAYPYIDGFNQMNMQPNPFYTKPYNPNKKTNANTLKLNNDMRKLWEQHSFWTKLAIMSIANGSPDVQLVSQRLLRNPDDFKKLFTNFYGPTASERFSELLKGHLLIAADLVNAAKRKDNAAVNMLDNKWHKNADEIADTLSHINPYWNRESIKNMLYEHLSLVKSEAIAILTNKYEDSISLFDKIEDQALMMADTFTTGILKQFPNKF